MSKGALDSELSSPALQAFTPQAAYMDLMYDSHMSYSLNSLKGGSIEVYIGDYYRGY